MGCLFVCLSVCPSVYFRLFDCLFDLLLVFLSTSKSSLLKLCFNHSFNRMKRCVHIFSHSMTKQAKIVTSMHTWCVY